MSCHHCENQHHHEHEHHHEKEENLSKYLYGIGILFFIVSFLPIFAPYKIELIVITLLCSGYEMLLNGIKNIFHLNFEEETLMTIAVISAFAIGEFTESCLVILLYRFGEFLEQRASNKSEDSMFQKNTMKLARNICTTEL